MPTNTPATRHPVQPPTPLHRHPSRHGLRAGALAIATLIPLACNNTTPPPSAEQAIPTTTTAAASTTIAPATDTIDPATDTDTGANLYIRLPASLHEGDCLNESRQDDLIEITTNDCAGTHDHQVVAIIETDDDTYPGADQLFARADTECSQAFTAKPQGAATGRTMGFIVPTQAMWDNNERRIICVASP